MRFLFKTFLCLSIALAIASPFFVGAQSGESSAGDPYVPPILPINTNLPIPGAVPISGPGGQGPAGLIANFYSFAFLIAGFLAFVMIVYGGVRYTFSAGNASAKDEAKDAIKQALLGLGLLLVAYLILRTINPDLTQLKMVPLTPYVPVPPATGVSQVPPPGLTGCNSSCTCPQYLENQRLQHPGQTMPTFCSIGPGVQAIISCLSSSGIQPSITASGAPSVIGGSHSPNSCHFGGRSCIGVGHAVDFSSNSSGGQNLTAVKTAVEQCGVSTNHAVSCYFEDANGARFPTNTSGVNHIHCNVEVAGCGCN